MSRLSSVPEETAIERVVPATEYQRDIWLVDQVSPEASLSYCLSLKVELEGELDRAATAQAVQALYARHDALRTTFSDDGEEMRIHRPGRAVFEFFDFSALESAAREAALRERLQLAVERGFDLRSGPVFRAELIALEPLHHVLLLKAHHIVCDGWSLGVLMSDFGRLYAMKRDGSGSLPPAPSFADFANDQPKALEPQNERFWKETFEQMPPPLELPPVKQRPPIRSFASARMDYVLDRSIVERVTERSRSHGYTLFSALFAAFNLVMSRISGNTDIAIGVPTAAQLRSGAPDLVGYGVTFLPVRSRIDTSVPFLSLVKTTREQFRAAMKHCISFARLITLLNMRGDPSRVPLVNIVFTSLPLSRQTVPGAAPLTMTGGHIARPYENFEILANVFLSDGEARVECQYNTSLFDDQSVRGWFAAFEAVLGAVADDFSLACDDIPIVSARDRALLESWNDTRAPVESAAVIHGLVESAVRAHPARIAASFENASLTCAALDSKANQLARTIRTYGAARGVMVGLLFERSLDMIVAELAVLKAGAAYVPLDPAYPRERLAYMLEQCGVSLVVTHAATRSLMSSLGGEGVRVLDVDVHAEAIGAESPTPLESDALAAGPDDPAYVVYTSGSTGKPKGVLVPHRTVVNFLAGMMREPGLDSSDRVLATTSFSFDPAVLEIFGPLIAGGHVIVASRDQTHDAYALRALLETSKATLMQSTPSAWRMLIEAGWRGAPTFKALTGSEALRPDLAHELLQRAGEVWNLYGPTETTVWATTWRVIDPERGIYIGRPVANAQVWVLDDAQRLCPIGVPGEIHIGGAGVALGYIERPELTGERFVANRFKPGEKLYRTGDRGRWRHDGLLEYLGRLDFQLKVRGYRIEPGEIEAALATHPQVGSSVVVAREDEPGDTRLVAYVVSNEPAPDAAQLREHLRRDLPDYMIPQFFVQLNAMPRLPNGKIDRNRLPAPTEASTGRSRDFVAPRTRAEIAVARIWKELLSVERVSVTDNFFDLGGHSLLAMSAIGEIEKELGTRLSARQMIYESLEQVARAAEPGTEDPASNAPAPRIGWLTRWFGRVSRKT